MSSGAQAKTIKVSRDLNLLAPAFRAAVEAAILDCNDQGRPGGPLNAMVYEGFRSPELQAIYFQRGRTVKPPRHTVTNAPTNEFSWHGYGLAVDVIHATQLWEPGRGENWFRDVAAVFARHGCKWGGNWTSPDLPHFQWGRCRASPSDHARSLIRSGGVQAVWTEVGADLPDIDQPAEPEPASMRPAAPHMNDGGDVDVLEVETLVGRSITELCRNGFTDDRANHCAHFVAHALGLDFGYTCRAHVGGSASGANLRVHEIFAECPRVGLWADADQSRTQLVFVTRRDVVSIATKTMGNIPQKHVGIVRDGIVYHYSNTLDRVTSQPVGEFLDTFQRLYAGDQALFFGEIPHSDLVLAVDPSGQAGVSEGTIAFELRRDQKDWIARRAEDDAGKAFLAGVEIQQPAKGFFGLFFPVARYYGPVFAPEDHAGVIGQWAYLLDLTAACESRGFMNLVNTYDRARFTFGFYQLAAHTPDDNLILFFREALADPEFRRLFPELDLRGGRVFNVSPDGTATDLEAGILDPASGEMQLQRFMAFLNPNRKLVDEQEVLQAARLIWWANQDGESSKLQVRVAARILGRKMARTYHPRYRLDGQLDTVCALIADIHHQGRAKVDVVRAAMAEPREADREAALLAIGSVSYPERIATLSGRLRALKSAGHLGRKRYVAATNEFA
ncbi:M15 family metallopeptidase [Sphingomonas aerophila]|uniref:Peptidase M15C domain-containing protein n=1 Tax=Sphingomonas aerophila TaxID=1344948 RepID=A0A7W9EVC5_9SPHN|nr:M15 family metallopeptidase [Sphingomonas aerophila]MBB5714577.1 hypothetical protein [Sphingomonas aerophila]